MNVLQSLIYRLKDVTGSGVGRSLNRLGKLSAGLIFDAVVRQYAAEGMKFVIPKQYTSLEMRGKFLVDTYELPERTLAKKYVPSDAQLLELGACIGVVSCTLNALLTNRTRHVAVEANLHLIETLEANREVNGAAFHVVCGVVSNAPVAHISTGKTMDSNALTESGTPVATMSVAALEKTYGLTFDALVMDIEGGEYDFARDNRDLLNRVRVAIIEFHPKALGKSKTEELRGWLTSAGLSKVDEMLTVECWKRRPLH